MSPIWSRNSYVILFLATLVFRLATALPLEQAGNMDGSYVLHVAENLARGRGFVEDILWNYLDQPAGLPHPSNLYWMPLQSILVAPFYLVFGISYHVAQIPFILLSSLLPLVTFYLARKMFSRDDYAWAAAIFTAFSGFYTIYWVTPDSFTPFALVASIGLFFIARGVESHAARYFFAAGIFAALSHLSRADGVFLLAVTPIALILHKPRNPRYLLLSTFYVLLGYLLLMSPWFARNYIALGTPYPSAGTKTLWLLNYDELFRYADDLTPARYFAGDIGSILNSKLVAAMRNIFVIVFGDLQFFLTPFAAVGLWQLRKRVELLPFFIYISLLYLSMTLAFTYPSWRGSVLHSATALLPFFAVVAPLGIDATVQWVARRRGAWNAAQAFRFFLAGFVALAIFLSGYLYEEGVFGWVGKGAGDVPLWNLRVAQYPAPARWLEQNAQPDDIVMVVDTPAFYNASHRRAIMIPTESVEAVFTVSRRYKARFLILEFDHPTPLKELYLKHVSVPGLNQVAEFQDALGRPVTLFEVKP